MPFSQIAPTKPQRVRPGGDGLGDLARVIVLNDTHNTFEGVAAALSAVLPDLSYDEGMRMANEIHQHGQSIVWIGHREQAELYWAQLEGRGLTMAPLD